MTPPASLRKAEEDGAFAASIVVEDIRRHSGGWWDCEGCGVCFDNPDNHAWEAFERNALEAIHYACVYFAEQDFIAARRTEQTPCG